MYKFKYYDGKILRNGGQFKTEFDSFAALHHHIPLVEGEYFEYREDGFDTIDDKGSHQKSTKHESLIAAIDELPPSTDPFPVDATENDYMHLEGMTAPQSEPTEEFLSTNIETGFTLDENKVKVPQYRAKTAEELIVDSNNAAYAEISRLEAEVTQRRIREAILGTGGSWLLDQDGLIVIERDKLQ